MHCERFETCSFYRDQHNRISDREYNLLVTTYCEGTLQERCKRLKYWRETGEAAPADMSPLGYQTSTMKKIYQ